MRQRRSSIKDGNCTSRVLLSTDEWHLVFFKLLILNDICEACFFESDVREPRVRVAKPGFRSKEIIVVTTLLDPEMATKEDLANLYHSRWNQELDLRDIKVTLQMDFLRCKTPELVHKEIWTHILAYNLIRTVMAQAASRHEIEPRTISFKGTTQTLEAFQPLISFQSHQDANTRQQLYHQLLDAVATHRIADRPDRIEPRMNKRRHKKVEWMLKPR